MTLQDFFNNNKIQLFNNGTKLHNGIKVVEIVGLSGCVSNGIDNFYYTILERDKKGIPNIYTISAKTLTEFLEKNIYKTA